MVVRATIAVGVIALALALGAAGTFAVTLPPQAKGNPAASDDAAEESGAPATLPMEACNSGTETAHKAIPETLPDGNVTPGHFWVPIVVDGNCTQMGG
jgi:hypothetical protein